MNEVILQLISLQALDLELDAIDQQIKVHQDGLTQRREASVERQAGIEKLEAQIEELEKEHRTLDLEMTEEQGHVKNRQSKMMQVQTGREQTALLKEIEDAKANVKEKEEKIVGIMAEVESLTSQITEEKNLLKGEEEGLAEEEGTVKKAVAAIKRSRKSQAAARDKESEALVGNLLRKYTVLRERRNGLAVVNVLGGVCQGCFMSIPPQKYNMLLSGEQFFDCPACQRIIYHQSVEEQE
ncbi:MAG: hypothetical protein H8E79_00320 [Desulfobulbaceae bacterium]|uniref:C4-type zinc ribbon domain-containing protein n=1 Tax=Candidatus Desulfatifera sulfidica TaxID=2841691 RepID=A0A8J6N6M7_9BACT|nr:hypothetical protein [Candidatus Desulfatifera sulfidica]